MTSVVVNAGQISVGRFAGIKNSTALWSSSLDSLSRTGGLALKSLETAGGINSAANRRMFFSDRESVIDFRERLKVAGTVAADVAVLI